MIMIVSIMMMMMMMMMMIMMMMMMMMITIIIIMCFHPQCPITDESLSECNKQSQHSRTLLRILTNPSKNVFCTMPKAHINHLHVALKILRNSTQCSYYNQNDSHFLHFPQGLHLPCKVSILIGFFFLFQKDATISLASNINSLTHSLLLIDHYNIWSIAREPKSQNNDLCILILNN